MAPRKTGKGIVKSGAVSSKASPLPEKAKEPAVPLTPEELIHRELKRPGYKTPVTILNERCQRLNWERPDLMTRQTGSTFSCAVNLKRHIKKSQNSPIESVLLAPHPPLTSATALEARHMAAVYALFRFNSGQPLSMTLPPHFRPYWTELLKEKASAPDHRAWEWADDPFNARKAVEDRQVRKQAVDQARAAASGGGGSNGIGGGGSAIVLGPSGRPLSNAEASQIPEVRMAPVLRELIEQTIKNQMLNYPEAILTATRESSSTPSGSNTPGTFDTAKLEQNLLELGFRKSHVISVIGFLIGARERIHKGIADGEGLDPLVLALSRLSEEEAAVEWLILHLPEDDLPKRFRPSTSVADFVSSARASSSKQSINQSWLVDKLIHKIGFPRSIILEILKLQGDGEFDEGQMLEILSRKLVGWDEDPEWGIDLITDRAVTDVSEQDWSERDERRQEEIEALEAVFGDRLKILPRDSSLNSATEVSISIPPRYASESKDDLTLHILFSASSPYPSSLYPTAIPPFYLTSTTLPSYIRLHLYASLLNLFRDPNREDFASILASGDGGVGSGLVDHLEEIWEEAVEHPPGVGEVTLHLLPKMSPAPTSEGPKAGQVGRVKVRGTGGRKLRVYTKEENEKLKKRTEEWQGREEFKSVMKGRMSLPAWKVKEEILQGVESNRVVVIIGETGSGKTTQLPQFILDNEIASLRGCSTNILVTQPRRVSALGVAARVAQERLEDVDRVSGSVGYAIRGERRAGPDTKLLFCTTGVLLRRLSSGGDTNLDGVSHVIVDEVHERSVDGDFLLLELRELLKRNSTIKIILMSATINHKTFTTYFESPTTGPAPLLEIHGRTFPVEDHYLEDVIGQIRYRPSNNVRPTERQTEEQLKSFKAEYESKGLGSSEIQLLDTVSRSDKLDPGLVAAVAAYAITEPNADGGGVLIFCPGVMEINQTIQALRSMNLGKVEIMPLHAQLSSQEQKRVFVKLPAEIRKIVVATNVAETSITIDDITVVVDTGKVKETQFEAERGMQLLVEVLTSKAASRQRKGRAGRTKPGKVFTRRMENNKMPSFPVPEILRTPLEALFLQVKAMRGDEDVKAFLSKAISPPSMPNMNVAWQTLIDLGAVEAEHETSNLTALGRHMSSIPVDLRLAKMLVLAAIFKCLDPIVTIAAILSSKPLFLSPMDKRDQAQKARAQFVTANSDLLTDAKAYTACADIKGFSGQRLFCEENFLSMTSVRDITTAKSDFIGALQDIGFVPPGSSRTSFPHLNTNSCNENLVKSIVLGGLYPRLAKVSMPKAKFEQLQSGTLQKEHLAKEVKFFDQQERVFLHPGSVLFGEAKIPSGFLAYWAKNQTTKVFLRDATEVPLYGLLLFGGKVTVNHFSSMLMLGNGWVKLKAWTRIGVLVNQLRRLLDASLDAQFDDPTASTSDEIIQAMLALLVKDGLTA
ncbi:atp-dependent rna helicase a [Phaffia rhodozyma]|uniref:RNA helicase n=1 Tax=Phaffia rhodozyma TaxID=264483 RepID=A0A0F7SW81_PHARH|nr:atp-dependent rna helicase a [Phaffia rhodozyma]